jgi:chromosomal replication initiation ATPase DnaA
MIRQLAFDLPGAPLRHRRADFFPSPANQPALTAIDAWQGWPGGKMLLFGPKGAGKTHLACIWAEMAGATLITASALPNADLRTLARTPIAVEDADHIAGDPAAEAALFHLHNLALPHNHLLITAATPPRDWGLALPDLQSRLQAAAVTHLSPPDDGLLSAVLIKLFADRQINVTPPLISYLVNRMDRSLSCAQDMVARLDATALALGRPVTRALAADLFPQGPDADSLDSTPNG